MSTSYEIRCPVHYDGDAIPTARWPEGDLRRYHVPLLRAIIANRTTIVAVAQLGITLTVEGAYGDPDLPTFLSDHADCNLVICDEYGEPVVDHAALEAERKRQEQIAAHVRCAWG